jgi:putative transposase
LHISLLLTFMCSLFKNKYRIEPCRLKGHDYSNGSRYFITICTHGKAIWFGNILNQQMILSEYGQIAKKLWQELPAHFSFVSLDEYVIMPDHVHGTNVPKFHNVPKFRNVPTTRTLHQY